MCGVAGFVSSYACSYDMAYVLEEMGKAIKSRGPDSAGIWSDESKTVGLSHRRLAIVDLSDAGHQPMSSVSGRFKLVFNGEIYNHLTLRDNLMQDGWDAPWRGSSDTETILACIEHWGVKKAVLKLSGMFAFALWDDCERTLILCRDRYGEKPMYYGVNNDTFFFASELKALRKHPSFSPEVDRKSIVKFLRYSYIPAPYSIFKGIRKLLPGQMFFYHADSQKGIFETYWDVEAVYHNTKKSSDENKTSSQVLKELEERLTAVIHQQMVADVPLGAFLSGGVDSSLVVALMQKVATSPVQTFSIGFHEKDYNEAEFAKAVATHLGTDHTELYVAPDDLLNVIPMLGEVYDEPFADSSQIPTILVSKLAREKVTVSLSGDGGDEVFCGYNRYLLTQRLWQKINKVPVRIRKFVAKCSLRIPEHYWDLLGRCLPSKYKLSMFGAKIHKGASVLDASNVDELYERLTSIWHLAEEAVILPEEDDENKGNVISTSSNVIEGMMIKDAKRYLPDDILVKVDRAAMSVSLESRVPYLDHTITEYAWRLPLSFKLRQGESKWCLRQILYRYVPVELIERPKKGFAIPLREWLRGPLKGWAESLLDPARLRREGFFDAEVISKKWTEHLTGERNWEYQLWNVLMFQLWYEDNFLKE